MGRTGTIEPERARPSCGVTKEVYKHKPTARDCRQFEAGFHSLKRSLSIERLKQRYPIKLLLFSIALKKLLTGAVKLNQVQLT